LGTLTIFFVFLQTLGSVRVALVYNRTIHHIAVTTVLRSWRWANDCPKHVGLIQRSINLLNTFYYQLTHTTLKNVVLLKHSKIDKNAPTCFVLNGNHLLLTKRVIFSQVLTLAPWRWFPCRPKHVGAFLSILEYFNNFTFFNVVCVSW